MDVVVDNSAGGESEFAEEVAAGLRRRGFAVELREPGPTAMFDTAVHVVATALAIRVNERPARAELTAIEDAVRIALLHRTSLRRRTRSVPIYFGETARVIGWIDPFD